MNFMASHSYEPTTAAALRPFLRAIVNVLRGQPARGAWSGEGWERRIPSERQVRHAAKILTNYRIRRERELIRRVARNMRVELGMKVPPILRG